MGIEGKLVCFVPQKKTANYSVSPFAVVDEQSIPTNSIIAPSAQSLENRRSYWLHNRHSSFVQRRSTSPRKCLKK